jgi:hypothetical protein
MTGRELRLADWLLRSSGGTEYASLFEDADVENRRLHFFGSDVRDLGKVSVRRAFEVNFKNRTV